MLTQVQDAAGSIAEVDAALPSRPAVARGGVLRWCWWVALNEDFSFNIGRSAVLLGNAWQCFDIDCVLAIASFTFGQIAMCRGGGGGGGCVRNREQVLGLVRDNLDGFQRRLNAEKLKRIQKKVRAWLQQLCGLVGLFVSMVDKHRMA